MKKIALLAMKKYKDNNIDLKIAEDNEIFDIYTFDDIEELWFTDEDLRQRGYLTCILA